MSKSSLKERAKAVRNAWKNEQGLVAEGKGTRDWSPEQQKDILDPEKGKAYDESGRAFEGQHMKSAEKYPEYQGDPGNIQFLTRDEHLKAHDGDWRNPTNWYYNPVTGEKLDFGNEKYIPCEIIELSNPISFGSQTNGTCDSSPKDDASDKKQERQSSTGDTERTIPNRVQQTRPPEHQSTMEATKESESLFSRIVSRWRRFESAHPIVAGIGKFVVKTVVIEGGERLIRNIVSSVTGSSSTQSRSNHTQTTRRSHGNSSFSPISPYADPTDNSDNSSPVQIDYPPERSSPKGHEVSGHYQHYGKDKKLKWVDPYSRGGKESDDNE